MSGPESNELSSDPEIQNTTKEKKKIPAAAAVRKITQNDKKLHEEARALVAEAIKNRKIFTIQGRYPVIRHHLKTQGWIEKDYNYCLSTYDPYLPGKNAKILREIEKEKEKERERMNKDADDSDDEPVENWKLLDEDLIGYEVPLSMKDPNCMDNICARLLKEANTNFYWINKTAGINYKSFSKHQIMNKLPACNQFTTKTGLLDVLRMLFERVGKGREG